MGRTGQTHLVTLTFCVLSLKFVGLTVPEISLIMCLSINKPGDLELWPFDLETGMSVTCVLGYLPTNFGLPSTFGSRVIHYVRDRQTDRRTDGRTKATLNAPYPTGGGIITMWLTYPNQIEAKQSINWSAGRSIQAHQNNKNAMYVMYTYRAVLVRLLLPIPVRPIAIKQRILIGSKLV